MRILVANRGEISARVLRTVRKLGHTGLALERPGADISVIKDLASEIAYFQSGLLTVNETYLSIDAILEVARRFSVDAIHPGYGFLSESSDFAKRVREENIIFIGPSAETLEILGDKVKAKNLAQLLSIPVVPGLELHNVESGYNLDEVLLECDKIGYPLMIKACHGGGGKGMRRVFNKTDLKDSINSASSEAKRSFGSGSIFIEKLISQAQHIEIQILGDKVNNCVHFFERDCSLQRNHQKLIEFSPAINVEAGLLEKLYSDSIKLGKAAKLSSLATVEYLVNSSLNQYYFIESNPRLQVEHTVTEEITGIDLVEHQILIALGGDCVSQENIKRSNSSFQVRICAETPEENFSPEIGFIDELSFPSNVRIETGYQSGSQVTEDYDSLLAKLISKGNTWEQSKTKILEALQQTIVQGINTNIGLLISSLDDKNFLRETYSVNTLENIIKNFDQSTLIKNLIFKTKNEILKSSHVNLPKNNFFSRSIKASTYSKNFVFISIPQLKVLEKVYFDELTDSLISLNPDTNLLQIDGYTIYIFENFPLDLDYTKENVETGVIEASLPCQIIEVMVSNDQIVKAGDKLLTYESMKTEYSKFAPCAGKISNLNCVKDAKMKKGEILLQIIPLKKESQ